MYHGSQIIVIIEHGQAANVAKRHAEQLASALTTHFKTTLEAIPWGGDSLAYAIQTTTGTTRKERADMVLFSFGFSAGQRAEAEHVAACNIRRMQ